MRTGERVVYEPQGQPAWSGTVAYVTEDGWVGIEDQTGRIDEVRGDLVRPEPPVDWVRVQYGDTDQALLDKLHDWGRDQP